MPRRATRRKGDDDDLAADILWGVSGKHGIAAFLGRKPSEVYSLIKNGLPVRKHSHRIISASRSSLRRYLQSTSC